MFYVLCSDFKNEDSLTQAGLFPNGSALDDDGIMAVGICSVSVTSYMDIGLSQQSKGVMLCSAATACSHVETSTNQLEDGVLNSPSISDHLTLLDYSPVSLGGDEESASVLHYTSAYFERGSSNCHRTSRQLYRMISEGSSVEERPGGCTGEVSLHGCEARSGVVTSNLETTQPEVSFFDMPRLF